MRDRWPKERRSSGPSQRWLRSCSGVLRCCCCVSAIGLGYRDEPVSYPQPGPTRTMNPLWLLLIGMLVVVGGVLVLRLHAFLALILGALVVAALTPGANVTSVGGRVAEGFANTARDIAI